jgi:hypothetical protein
VQAAFVPALVAGQQVKITLVVVDQLGNQSAPATQTVTVQKAPVATFTASNVLPGQNIPMNATGSEGDLASYHWTAQPVALGTTQVLTQTPPPAAPTNPTAVSNVAPASVAPAGVAPASVEPADAAPASVAPTGPKTKSSKS